jgi:ADP-ribose pyrophosphatase YjhB (NUDIX family)
LPTLIDDLKRRAFWVFARTCFALYRRLPLFGTLRASIGIIQKDGKFLIIHRNDGRGLSLPGGISSWREAEEETLGREILEETGLSVRGKELKLKYYSEADVPCMISVYEVQADGELKNSWEGSAKWTTLAEMEPRLMQSQRPLLELIRKMASDAQTKNARS